MNHIVTANNSSYLPSMHGNSSSFGNTSLLSAMDSQDVSQATAAQIATLQAKLDKRLGPEYVSHRPGPGGGRQLTYIEGWKAIQLANEVFGYNGWSSSITSLTTDFIDYNNETQRFNVGVTAIVRVTLRDGTYHEDIGYGLLENSKQKGPALDKCKKEAVTDGIKRALRNFGNVLGNCLYDKSYVTEVSKIKVPPAKFDRASLYRRPEFDETAHTSTSTPQPPIQQPPQGTSATTTGPPAPAIQHNPLLNAVVGGPPLPARNRSNTGTVREPQQPGVVSNPLRSNSSTSTATRPPAFLKPQQPYPIDGRQHHQPVMANDKGKAKELPTTGPLPGTTEGSNYFGSDDDEAMFAELDMDDFDGGEQILHGLEDHVGEDSTTNNNINPPALQTVEPSHISLNGGPPPASAIIPEEELPTNDAPPLMLPRRATASRTLSGNQTSPAGSSSADRGAGASMRETLMKAVMEGQAAAEAEAEVERKAAERKAMPPPRFSTKTNLAASTPVATTPTDRSAASGPSHTDALTTTTRPNVQLLRRATANTSVSHSPAPSFGTSSTRPSSSVGGFHFPSGQDGNARPHSRQPNPFSSGSMDQSETGSVKRGLDGLPRRAPYGPGLGLSAGGIAGYGQVNSIQADEPDPPGMHDAKRTKR